MYKTEQRNILLSFLKENPDHMFSVRQIEEALSEKNISRSAVYRNIAELEAAQKIKRCTKNGCREALFQYYDSTSCRTHIHLSCKNCGKIFHLEGKAADNFVSEVEQSDGFEISRGETVIVGVCRDCRQ